ncbi:hypothetical protein TNCV_3949161 [Trichonephila clavipes]|nr:hypothetical protein TNCV_3949161 [Trichonephila clavipes]
MFSKGRRNMGRGKHRVREDTEEDVGTRSYLKDHYLTLKRTQREDNYIPAYRWKKEKSCVLIGERFCQNRCSRFRLPIFIQN